MIGAAIERGKTLIDRVFTVSSKTTLLLTVGTLMWISELPIPSIDQVRYGSAVAIAFILGQKFKEAFARNAE